MAVKMNLSTSDVDELGRVLNRLNMKTIPTWDPVYGEQKTIQSHLKSFEIAIGGAELDDEDKARELATEVITKIKIVYLDIPLDEDLVQTEYEAFKDFPP